MELARGLIRLCEPATMTMAMLALTAATTAATVMTNKAPTMPAVENPATPAPNARDSAAQVKIGADDTNKDPNTPADYNGFTPKRVAAQTLGGLGRGGLGL